MTCYLPRRVDWCENTPSMVTSLVLAPETAPGIETMGDVTYAAMSTSPSTATHEHTARRTRERDTPPARAVGSSEEKDRISLATAGGQRM